jgi:GrpB-like predicted nucleotidyltransferase (UPF0157 family)
VTRDIKKDIFIVPYDATWPRLFEEEAPRVRRALGTAVVTIEHIGSTAVPGLAAKPIVDILVGLRALSLTDAQTAAMERAGYEFRGEAGVPGRLHFHRLSAGRHLFNVHIVEHGGAHWRNNLLFRNYLRNQSEEARQYVALKRREAAKHPRDIWAYSEGKRAFIEALIKKARRESDDASGEKV